MKKLLYLAVPALLLVTSCSDDKLGCLLDTLSNPSGVITTYSYDDDGRVERIDYYDPDNQGYLTGYMRVKRNSDEKITQVKLFAPSGIPYREFNVTYTSGGQLGNVYIYDNNDNDQVVDEYYATVSYYYGGDDKLDSMKYVLLFVTDRTTLITWTGDNITGITHKFNGAVEYSRTFEYDTRENAYGNMAEINQVSSFDIGAPDVQSFSRNNITSMSHYDSGGGLIGTYPTTYTEDADGRIVGINGLVTLAYTCD